MTKILLDLEPICTIFIHIVGFNTFRMHTSETVDRLSRWFSGCFGVHSSPVYILVAPSFQWFTTKSQWFTRDRTGFDWLQSARIGFELVAIGTGLAANGPELAVPGPGRTGMNRREPRRTVPNRHEPPGTRANRHEPSRTGRNRRGSAGASVCRGVSLTVGESGSYWHCTAAW